jgi:23S rRNA pseudouridine1911/1915/1917 synthase
MRISHEFELEISEDNANMRLDKALALHDEIESRSQATRLIDIGCVSLAEKKVKPSKQTEVGEVYLVKVPFKELPNLEPMEMELDIVYEDEHLMVINKPSGLVVHPSVGHYQDTLVNALVYYSQSLSSGFESHRPGLVHRIDKDTSGLIVVAKDDSSQRHLASQFKHKTVHRIYECVCLGPFKDQEGTIRSFLRSHPVDRKKFSSERLSEGMEPKGKEAVTHYKVLKVHNSGLCLVQLQLETGRTHQIRVHLSEAGHPILEDPIYGRKNKLKKAPRLMLHAAELGFVHPKTKEKLSFRAEWPEETKELLSELKFYELG